MRKETEHFYNEIYSYYYTTVARLLRLAVRGELTPEKEREILYENQDFAEELITEKLHDLNQWYLMKDRMTLRNDRYVYETDIVNEPKRPVTELEKSWLKSIIADPRIRLFPTGFEKALEDVEPLFDMNDFMWAGVYSDGDDYTDPGYIARFRTIISAIHEGNGLALVSSPSGGDTVPKELVFIPDHLEYSEKEDKFSLLGSSVREGTGTEPQDIEVIPLSRIIECRQTYRIPSAGFREQPCGTIVFDLTNRADSLERVMTSFSHYNKNVRQTGEDTFRVEADYLLSEEHELVMMQIMPYAAYIDIVSPERIRLDVAERIRRQRELFAASEGIDI